MVEREPLSLPQTDPLGATDGHHPEGEGDLVHHLLDVVHPPLEKL